MSDDLRDRIVEAAARAYLDAPEPGDTMLYDVFHPITERHRAGMRAALAAVVREAGLDAEVLDTAAGVLDDCVRWRREYEAAGADHYCGEATTDGMERTAAFLRALAGIGDG